MKPLCIDLFCGCFGWSAGWLELGGRVIGYDLEHLPHHGPVPDGAELVLQDVLTLDGARFKDASLILCSPPCQAYSYRAMPWKRAKALPPPDNSLFDACFRIQREASEAAGHHIPMVVENVRGAQPWVGRSKFVFGSFHLWGDIPALMPKARSSVKIPGQDWNRFKATGEVSPHWRMEGVKIGGPKGADWFAKHNRDEFLESSGIKQRKSGTSSKSNARKAASAQIAKIPLPLARWIARAYKPRFNAACHSPASQDTPHASPAEQSHR